MVERGKGAVTPTSTLARKLVEGYLTLRAGSDICLNRRPDEAIRHIHTRVDA